ncbi:MAG: hypothetical protein G8D88_21435, partial [gamma proteobacterium symbiont of Ctena orbiculata]
PVPGQEMGAVGGELPIPDTEFYRRLSTLQKRAIKGIENDKKYIKLWDDIDDPKHRATNYRHYLDDGWYAFYEVHTSKVNSKAGDIGPYKYKLAFHYYPKTDNSPGRILIMDMSTTAQEDERAPSMGDFFRMKLLGLAKDGYIIDQPDQISVDWNVSQESKDNQDFLKLVRINARYDDIIKSTVGKNLNSIVTELGMEKERGIEHASFRLKGERGNTVYKIDIKPNSQSDLYSHLDVNKETISNIYEGTSKDYFKKAFNHFWSEMESSKNRVKVSPHTNDSGWRASYKVTTSKFSSKEGKSGPYKYKLKFHYYPKTDNRPSFLHITSMSRTVPPEDDVLTPNMSDFFNSALIKLKKDGYIIDVPSEIAVSGDVANPGKWNSSDNQAFLEKVDSKADYIDIRRNTEVGSNLDHIIYQLGMEKTEDNATFAELYLNTKTGHYESIRIVQDGVSRKVSLNGIVYKVNLRIRDIP